jgi:hypothetical protein
MGGRAQQFVPIRERSLELFGDEKRLDALMKSAWLRDEILSWELPRAREVVSQVVVDPVDAALAWFAGVATILERPLLI